MPSTRKGWAILAALLVGFAMFMAGLGQAIDKMSDRPDWQQVTGQVEYTSTVVTRGEQWTIIQLDNGVIYSCSDPRCSMLLPSEKVWLWCYRVSEAPAPSSWTCRFGRSEDTVVYPTTDG